MSPLIAGAIKAQPVNVVFGARVQTKLRQQASILTKCDRVQHDVDLVFIDDFGMY